MKSCYVHSFCEYFFLGASIDRPTSASSVRGGTRQRLQHPSVRRMHAKEKTKDVSYGDRKRKPSLISTISLIESKSNMQEDLSPTTPLRHLAFKKIHFGPIEVKVSF